MPGPDPGTVTQLLGELRDGRSEAVDELFSLLYAELRERARRRRRQWEGEETLNTTAILHEAYLKLAAAEDPDWENRAHFLAVASRAMRQVLLDYARERRAARRGGERRRVSFDELRLEPGEPFSGEPAEAVLALEASLSRLEEENPRHGRIVECRFFGGMTIPDTASALEISPATVKRGWAIARAWLYRDMRDRLGSSEA